MTDRTDITPEESAEAAEYALGLLSPDRVTGFEARLRSDTALRSEVVAWQTRFASMAEAEVAEVAPPARLQAAVEAAAFGETGAGGSVWNRLAFWRGLSLVASTVAVVAVGVVLLPVFQPPQPPERGGIPPGTLLMTHLVPTEGSDLGLAVTREPSGALQVRRVAGAPGADRAQELWIIAGDNAPVSLGVLGDDPLTTLSPGPEAQALFAAGAALAISDEPAGGSPTGAPTGDILALGTLVAL